MESKEKSSKSIGLAELIVQVREEIEQAQKMLFKSGKQAMIDWESADIEVSFGVTTEADASGKVNLHIFAIEAGARRASQEIHRLTLHLKPHEDSGESYVLLHPGRAVATLPREERQKIPGLDETTA